MHQKDFQVTWQQTGLFLSNKERTFDFQDTEQTYMYFVMRDSVTVSGT